MKKIIAIAAICISMFAFTGCNKQIEVFYNYSYNYAILSLPNGEIIEDEVQSWIVYGGTYQIQVKIDDIVYLVHSSNIVLMNK